MPAHRKTKNSRLSLKRKGEPRQPDGLFKKKKSSAACPIVGIGRPARGVRSSDGIFAQFAVENGDGVCRRATSRSTPRQPAFQFARQSNGDASERTYKNDNAKTQHGLCATAEQMRHGRTWCAHIGPTRRTAQRCDRPLF